jgi:hypothetical protein
MPRKRQPRCGFCGRRYGEVRVLLAGRDEKAFICDVCILLAMHGLVEEMGGPSGAAARERAEADLNARKP